MRSWLAARFVTDTTTQRIGAAVLPADEIAKLQRFRQAVDWSLTPAPKPMVVMALTRLAAHFWGERGPSEWKIVFEDYADDLAEFPADIIGEGIAQYRRSAKWWPKVSELLELMKPKLAERRLQLARLTMLAGQPPTVDRNADRQAMRDRLGEAYDAYNAIPWQRRYKGTPEDFRTGWTAAEDRAAFAEGWGS